MGVGHGVPIWRDEKVLELDSGDDHTTLGVYLCHTVVHFKTVKMINVTCVFYLQLFFKSHHLTGQSMHFLVPPSSLCSSAKVRRLVSWHSKTGGGVLAQAPRGQHCKHEQGQ